MTDPTNFDELVVLYACEWLEDKGPFTRVTTEAEESTWYCTLCGSLDVDAHEGVCFNCGEGLEGEDDYV